MLGFLQRGDDDDVLEAEALEGFEKGDLLAFGKGRQRDGVAAHEETAFFFFTGAFFAGVFLAAVLPAVVFFCFGGWPERKAAS